VLKGDSMANKGFSHIGLATRNLDETKEFYENILGFKTLLIDVIEIQEGGRIRHLIMDAGRDQVVAFMEARDVPGIPGDYDAGINRGLGLPNAFYHVAFEAGSEGALRQKREELIRRGVKVTEIVDHDFAKSIYFKDPNGIQLEFCCSTRDLTDEEAKLRAPIKASVKQLDL
jgi:catechol 2,3-dioxygenase-like lactoylglutathione lyase family enzyme